jgi:hypothetical protein
MHLWAACRQFAIFRVDRCVAWLRNWIIWLTLGTWIFTNHTRVRVVLPSQMFKLSDSSEAKVIGIIHDRGRLKLFAVQRRVLKLK